MTAEEYFKKGKECYDNDEYKEAIKYFCLAINLDSEYSKAYNMRGNAKGHLKEYESSIKDYDKAIDLNPNYASAFYNRGNSKSSLEDYYSAIKDYDKAIKIDKNFVFAYCHRGNAKRNLNNFIGAIEDYGKAIKIDSNFAIAYCNRGVAKSDLRNYTDSIQDYNEAIKLDPNFAIAFNNRGLAKKNLKKYNCAIEDFSKAIKLDSSDKSAYINRGYSKIYLEDFIGAIEDSSEAIKLDPNDATAYCNRGIAKSNLKEHTAAIEDYTIAIKLSPNFVSAYNSRGNAKSDLENYIGAIQDYNEAIRLDPNLSQAYNGRGNAKNQLKKYDSAIEDYNRAIKLNPNYLSAWNGKLTAYTFKKFYIAALNCLFRASYIGSDIFPNQTFLFHEYPTFPFFIFRQIQNNLPINQYFEYTEIIKLARQACLPLYTFITHKAVSNTNNYNKEKWQRWLGNINYYCGDPLISYEIFKAFVEKGSKTLSDYYYLIQNCFEFVEDADPYIGKAISIAEKVRDESYIRPKASNPYLDFSLLQQYYAGLIFEIDEEPKDALTCFEKVAPYFLPAKYKQMQLLYDLDDKDASENIRRLILEDESKLNQTKGFSKGLETHTFDLETDRIEKVFPHYFHYLEIEPAITHLVNLSKEDADFELQYPGNQPNFWELFKVNSNDLEQTRIRANAEELLKQYEAQIEEYGQSFVTINPPSTIETDIDFKLTFKSLMDSPKEELLTDLGLHIQKFGHSLKQYEELSTYFMLKGDLTHYEKLLLDFYAALNEASKQKNATILSEGLGQIVESLFGGELYQNLTRIIAGTVIILNPLTSAALTTGAFITTQLAAGVLAHLFKKHFEQIKSPTIQNFVTFKNDFENFIAQEKERLGDMFEKQYPIEELYK